MHNEKEGLVEEMNQLQIQNQQLLDELEALSKGQFLEIQKRHAQPQHYYANQLKSRLYVAGPNQPLVYPSQQNPSPERGGDKPIQYPPQTLLARRPEVNHLFSLMVSMFVQVMRTHTNKFIFNISTIIE